MRGLVAAHVDATRTRWLARAAGHDEVDEILATGPAHDAVERVLQEAVDPAATAARAALADDPAWSRIAATLAVPPREVEWLALLAACELDPRLLRVLGYLEDSPAPVAPSPALGARLWGWPRGYRPGPGSALAGWSLAEPVEAGWSGTTPWAVDPEVAAFVAGEPGWADFHRTTTPLSTDGLACLHPVLLERMVEAVTAVRGVGVEVELVGARGTGRRTLLAQLAAALDRPAVQLDGRDPVRALRTARLLDALPVWVADDDERTGVDTAPGALTLVARPTASTTRSGAVRLSWDVPGLTVAQRQGLWSDRTPHAAPRLVTDWELSPGDVAAGASAADAGGEVATGVLRRRLRSGPLESMTALACPYDWDDLVVSESVAAQLARLRTQVLRSLEVLDTWEFRRLAPSASGTTALFAGPSGTGKTMAVQVLARSLELDLYRVDLAEVVNKYVGETEKRLAAVFDQCERSNVMVLFDEADALFGQRTRVQDAHDRYANIEIDYLLQRLDSFRGVAVLATNRKSDLDAAFLRRLRVVVDFVQPTAGERLRLWQSALLPATSTGERVTDDDLDLPWLAAQLELTGAEIKSVALAAAFDARDRDELIGTGHVVDAARRELVKRGTVLRVQAPTVEPVAVLR